MSEITAHQVLKLGTRHYDQIIAWVREQGLNEHDVWSIRIIGPLIKATVYLRDESGSKRTHPDYPDMAWTRTRWLRRRTSPPDILKVMT